jgi:hypothetical protein
MKTTVQPISQNFLHNGGCYVDALRDAPKSFILLAEDIHYETQLCN